MNLVCLAARRMRCSQQRPAQENERGFWKCDPLFADGVPSTSIHGTMPRVCNMKSTQQGTELSNEPVSHLCPQCSLKQPRHLVPVVISLPGNDPEAEHVGAKLLCSSYHQTLCFQGSNTKLILLGHAQSCWLPADRQGHRPLMLINIYIPVVPGGLSSGLLCDTSHKHVEDQVPFCATQSTKVYRDTFLCLEIAFFFCFS